ncbi:simple sugar transport system permease protein [Hydrogenispora ethanolica]|uniref:Simple sugar transport system permease protein n=1 Tax=Hydrogenispora ethanolica TaxID=1082276 RepID=A0A4R1RIT0_HYDET|nr:ABC transporter permease [Hydrogenispora ethanolica]TCL65896.1 simple sugar transport system permease protein [Hydrogenispora ethanolica]
MNNAQREVFFEVVRTLVAVFIALALFLLIIVLISKEPLDALGYFLLGPLSSLRRFGNVIEMMIPFIFTGLSVCVMFQAKQFNMISEGGFFIGGLAAALVAVKLALPLGIHPLVAILFGGLIGGLAGYIPGVLKTKWNANELVSSLMLNYVLLYLGLFMLNNLIRDPNAGNMASFMLSPVAKFPVIIPDTRVHLGLGLAILMVVLVYYFLYRTHWGYALRMTGLNQKFAAYTGINTMAVIAYAQVIGGAIAGMGGATEILGMYDRFQWQSLPGYGFDGIIVAILARQNPLLVPVAALFLAYLRIGADIMSRMSDVPSEVVSVIQAIMIMLIAAYSFLAGWRHRVILKQSKANMAVPVGRGN